MVGEAIPSEFLPSNVMDKHPVAVLDKRSIKRRNHAVVQWLVQWTDASLEEASWEDAEQIEKKFPTFDPRGQGSFQGGSIDMIISETMHTEVKMDKLKLENLIVRPARITNNPEIKEKVGADKGNAATTSADF